MKGKNRVKVDMEILHECIREIKTRDRRNKSRGKRELVRRQLYERGDSVREVERRRVEGQMM